MRDDFAVFILTHGRADNVVTYRTLRKQGYTGRIVLVVDDEDSQAEAYKARYGDEVFIFNKQSAIDMTERGDNFDNRKVIIYARNYSFEIAKQLGLKYFLQFDDDYEVFYNTFDNENRYISAHQVIKNLDRTFSALLDFLIESGSDCVAFAQGGDFVGGDSSTVAKIHAQGKLSRKAMNSFFFATDCDLRFVGSINEDVNLYTSEGRRGRKIFTYPRIRLKQKITQSNDGGMTDVYLDGGTYKKSFYTVLYSPSCVRLGEMGVSQKRIHHKVKWKYTVPMILSEELRKPDD